ncbi:MAG: beta-ketoacyl-[acyl-carrier-protein] synthase family protein [Candidatus Omnitrophota bacterium]|nr:beta-ketoacyl-[acyl-carrier-protein] synthase family protein [Candidatus Omnitrophota bacterium]
MKKRVVVTGLGVISSIGIGKNAFWDNLLKGKSGISEVASYDTSKHVTHKGGEIKNFNPEDFISKKRIRLIGRASQLAMSATKLALEDAQLSDGSISNYKTSVCLGTTMGEIQSVEKADHTWIKSGQKEVGNLALYQSPLNNIPSSVAMEFKLKGRNRIFTTACAAGNYAIGYGYDLLQFNESDIIVAGGSDSFSWIAFTGFNKVSATAPEKCQPFDKNRKGIIPGEGSGIVVLETLDQAKKRNAHIYAEILGYGLSCDAHHMTNPQAEGLASCMKNALKDAGLTPNDIDYISAHGTGTIFNDRAECAAIKQIFGDKKIPVSSIKSMLGHTMGAASAIEAITCCLVVENNIMPPTINYETPDPECDIDCVPNVSRKQTINIALNNGFAFGGNNACLVIKKFQN